MRLKYYHITTGSSKNRTIFLITMVMNIINNLKQNQINAGMCLHYIYLISPKVKNEAPVYIIRFCAKATLNILLSHV